MYNKYYFQVRNTNRCTKKQFIVDNHKFMTISPEKTIVTNWRG